MKCIQLNYLILKVNMCITLADHLIYMLKPLANALIL